MGINGAFATNSPSGAKSAHEKSSLSLMLVLIDVCWRDRPIASATLMKRFANSVSMIGSGPFEVLSFFEFAMSQDDRGVYGSTVGREPDDVYFMCKTGIDFRCVVISGFPVRDIRFRST